MDVERTFTLNKPIDQVFAYFSDFTNTEGWDPGTVKTTRISGDGGLGTTYRNKSRFLRRTVELTYETIAYEEPTKVVFKGRNGKTTTRDELSFSPDGDGRTRMHYRAVFEFPKPLSWILPPVLRIPINKLADETVDSIKDSVN